MQKKGVSPLIATILLVAFTITIAAMLMTWGRSLLEKQILGAESAQARIDCIENVEVDVRSACYKDNKVDIVIENKRNYKIDSFLIRLVGKNSVAVRPSLAGALGPYEAKTISAVYDPIITGEIEEAVMIPKIKIKDIVTVCQSNTIPIKMKVCQ